MRTLDKIIAEAKKAFAEDNKEVLQASLQELHRLPGGITQDIRSKLRMSPLVISQVLDTGEPPLVIPTAVRSNSTGLTLDEISAKIRELDKTGVKNTIEVGKCFMQAKESLEHGKWCNWVSQNTGYTPQHARKLIRVHGRFANRTYMFHLRPSLLFPLLSFSPTLEEEVANAIHCFEVLNDMDIPSPLLTKLSSALVGIKEATPESMTEALNLMHKNKDALDYLTSAKNASGTTVLSDALTAYHKAEEEREKKEEEERIAKAEESQENLEEAAEGAILGTSTDTPTDKVDEPSTQPTAASQPDTESVKRNELVKSVNTAVGNSWNLDNSSLKEIADEFIEVGVSTDKLDTFLTRMNKVKALITDAEQTTNITLGNK